MADTIQVTVDVVDRPPMRGFWSALCYWPPGTTTREVTAKQLAELEAEAALGLLSVRRHDGKRSPSASSGQRLLVNHYGRR